MKTGIVAHTGNVWGDEGYKKLAELGYSAVDFDFISSNNPIYTLNDEEVEKHLDRQKALIDEAGMFVSQVHGPWQFPPKDSNEEERAERMDKMKKSIAACARIGCKYWVIHPIMPFGCENPEGTDEEYLDLNFKFMRQLLEYAKGFGVTICLENMPFKKQPLAKPAEILDFVKKMNDDNFKICLDTGHVSVFNDIDIAEEVRRLGKEIKVLHVHDNNGKQDNHFAPYFGVINWAEFGQALKDIGFDGVISLETVPSKKLPAELYEEMCGTYCKIAKSIVE